jgi:hypothetical protein
LVMDTIAVLCAALSGIHLSCHPTLALYQACFMAWSFFTDCVRCFIGLCLERL